MHTASWWRTTRAVARRAGELLLLVTAFAVVASVVEAGPKTSKTTTSDSTASAAFTFAPSGLEGGGFMNVVEIDPHNPEVVLAGGDVSGVHRSTDGGRTWTPSSAGILAGHLGIAAIEFSPTVPGTVYAAVGDRGSSGLAVSTDGGRSWSIRSTFPHFFGVLGSDARLTGNLLAVDPGANLLYAATLDQGVLRSNDDGVTWASIGATGLRLRTLAFDRGNPSVLYAAGFGGVYRIDDPAGAATATALPGAPAAVEELALVGGKLYAAAATDGLFVSSDRGVTWTKLNTGELLGVPHWVSITGYQADARTVLYAGAANPAAVSGGRASVLRSSDGGTTWLPITPESAVRTTVSGPLGSTWWLSLSRPALMLGKSKHVTNDLAVVPGPVDEVILAGKAGVWATEDGGTNWYPMVRGLGLTVVRDVLPNRDDAGRVTVALADWTVTGSTDRLTHVSHGSLTTGGSYGQAIALDAATTPDTVYVGTADPFTNTNGEIYSTRDATTGPWVNEGLGAATGGKRALAVAVRTVNGAPVILAAVEEGGVWRKAGGVWTQVSKTAMANRQRSRAASMAWRAGTSVVYLYDRQSGVWRSRDNGRTWSLIWSKPSPYDMTGYVTIDPLQPTSLYVSVAFDGVYRLDKAETKSVGGGITPVRLGAFASPGAMTTAANGDLYVAEVATGTVPARLARSTDRGRTWANVDDVTYRGAALFPTALTIDGDGSLYVSLRGNGILRGRPTG